MNLEKSQVNHAYQRESSLWSKKFDGVMPEKTLSFIPIEKVYNINNKEANGSEITNMYLCKKSSNMNA